jgi:uncharacterized membrane protein YfcA
VFINLLVNVQLVPSARGLARWNRVATMTVAACLAAPAGAVALASADEEAMRKAIGVMVLVSTLLIASGWRLRGGGTAIGDAAAGALGGILNGAAAIGGPPITLYILGREGAAAEKRADIIIIFAVVHTATLAGLILADLMTLAIIYLSIALMPFFLLSTWLGTALFRRFGEHAFDRVAQIFLFAIAVAAILA